MSPNQWRSNRVCSMDLRIGYFPSNRIWNRICGYDSNSNRISNRIRVVVYMFNADCPVGVVYLIMCNPTLLHTLYVLFFVCTVGLRVYNLLITYDDDDDDHETERPTRLTFLLNSESA